jgi:phosphatidylinositol glycan class C protein
MESRRYLTSSKSHNIPSFYKPPWKRILYEKQPYKDNYYDPTKFFDFVRIVKSDQSNKHNSIKSIIITYWSIFLDTTIIAQQISAVTCFLAIHRYLIFHKIGFFEVMSLNFLLILCGILCYYFYNSNIQSSLWGYAKISGLFIACVRIVAPLLQTLTSSFSEDTIYALAITLSTIHLVFHDYSPGESVNSRMTMEIPSASPQYLPIPPSQSVDPSSIPSKFQSKVFIEDDEQEREGKIFTTLSLNTAIFTAIVLASRLDHPDTVVAYIVLAVISFSLFPMIMKKIKELNTTVHLTFAILQWILTGYGVFYLNEDRILFIVYEVLIAFVWLIVPLWLLCMFNYQKAYRGAWDIAEI